MSTCPFEELDVDEFFIARPRLRLAVIVGLLIVPLSSVARSPMLSLNALPGLWLLCAHLHAYQTGRRMFVRFTIVHVIFLGNWYGEAFHIGASTTTFSAHNVMNGDIFARASLLGVARVGH